MRSQGPQLLKGQSIGLSRSAPWTSSSPYYLAFLTQALSPPKSNHLMEMERALIWGAAYTSFTQIPRRKRLTCLLSATVLSSVLPPPCTLITSSPGSLAPAHWDLNQPSSLLPWGWICWALDSVWTFCWNTMQHLHFALQTDFLVWILP